ncbi:porin family protein [Mesoterricola silvestris]|uniref:Porin n=1 Tax=Mesoterricola silvestris TaxID=2927979 RepID=A0AA48H988_9BACT|nr:hypothetical protein [Mesoterricola silvestris]BDU74118.1 hypothetical protein METEAL_32920 [Mesoterricola silvestris]
MKALHLPLLTACLALSPLRAQTPPEDLAKRVDALSRELERVKGELEARPASGTVLGGYGEIQFSHFTKDGAKDTADLRRFVLALTHRFDDRTELVTELEVEHAVSSSDDKGEVEIEQAYIQHRLSPTWSLRGGLFLVPAGLLNEHHEPTAYYGVERNAVETAIIPSTWREGGLQVVGAFDNGILLQAGVSTGFDFSKWDAASTEGAESPLGAVHQELSGAKSHDLAAFAALNWRGLPGLLLGGSWFHAKGAQGQPAMPPMAATLWDVHARWTPGPFDLSALYARGTVADTAAFNQTRVGSPTLVPSRFEGWYGQAAWHLWSSGSYALAPFVRYESVNTAAAFEPLAPASLTPEAAPAERIWTAGLTFNLNPHVVLKADLRRFRNDTAQNRVNLGLGWAF